MTGSGWPPTFEEREIVARIAYEAYGDTAQWTNYRGDPMPQWVDLYDRGRTCWLMAVSAAVNHVLTPPNQRQQG